MQASPSTSTPSEPTYINAIQTSSPKGNQQSDGKKKGRGRTKNQDGKGNANKPDNDVGEGMKESKKR